MGNALAIIEGRIVNNIGHLVWRDCYGLGVAMRIENGA
jgi:hypothetical protein